ncbi:hypothetical protein Golax_014196 [Gossypium laxum]|uniref:Uncharacterized protein n=1 Tax=Gossypium laxum TaxID=34288 RepID=A0A7J8ZTZ5_9ROSI|nr:hypothetical protein [Gossypium laxum]
MAFSNRKNLFRTLLVLSLLVAWIQVGAMRPLDGDLVVQSLPRGPVTPSGPNPCTNIPGRGGGVCKLGVINVAGNVMHSPAVFPGVVAELGVASTAKRSHDEDMSS